MTGLAVAVPSGCTLACMLNSYELFKSYFFRSHL
jgi:hypothetical protein